MSDSDPSKWEGAAHTAAKHQILRYYLSAWFPILSWSGRVLYIDGFAGRGRYGDGSEGSPQIALRALLDHGYLKRMSGCEFQFIFIEKNRENCEALEAELQTFKDSYPTWPTNVNIFVYNASFDEHMRELINALKEQNRQLAPTFAFVDPFGYTKFPMDLLADLAKNPRSELLINFMVGFVQRFVTRDGQENAIRELFGKSVEEVLRELEGVTSGDKRVRRLVNIYERALLDASNIEFSQRFFMLNKSGNVSYALVHVTDHETGLSRMKAAMWKIAPGGDYSFSDRLAGVPVLFSPSPDLGPLRSAILTAFNGRTGVTADEVKRYALVETPYREPHVTPLLKEFEKTGQIDVHRPKGKRQFSAGVTFDFY